MSTKRNKLISKFKRMLLVTYLIIIAISVPLTWYLTKIQVHNQANKELSLLVDMVKSIRNVVREDTRPHFLPKGEFFPPVVSSTVMAKTVATKFSRLRPEYSIRIISDNPLNPEDFPSGAEINLLKRFRSDVELKNIIESGVIRGKQFLVSAAPAKVKKGCLRCHGDPDDAPTAISDKYGKSSGYGWQIGKIVGASVVGVPLADVNDLVLRRSIVIFSVVTALFALLFILISNLVKRSIIAPLIVISDAAHAASRGAINKPIKIDSKDEIGDLANSFELMRRSFVAVLKRLQARDKED